MKSILLILFMLSNVLNHYSNPQTPDDVEDIDNIIIHENRFERLLDLAKLYIDTNPEFAFNCAYKANEIANQTNDVMGAALSYVIMGDLFNNNGSPMNAIPYYENAIENMNLCNDYKSIYELYVKLSFLYDENHIDDNKSVESMINAIDYAHKCNCIDCVLDANIALAELYAEINDYDSAITIFDKILEFNTDEIGSNYIAKALAGKSKVLINQKQYDYALMLIDSSLSLCDSLSDINLLIDNYSSKAQIYDSLNILDETNNYYKYVIKLAYDYKEYEDCGQFMYNYGMHEIRQNNIDKAIDILKILCDSTETFKWFDICYHSYYQLSRCYAMIDKYEEAYHLFKKYDIIYDSAIYANQEQRIDKINTVHHFSLNVEEMKSKELELVNENNNRTNKIIAIAVIGILCIMLITIIFIYSRHKILYYKNAETTYMQQMRIDKMQSEIMEMQIKNNKEMLVNLALHLKSYIESIDHIKSELKSVIDSSDVDNKGKIKTIYTNIQNNHSLINNAQNISKQINEIYKDFLSRLEQRYPDLTKSEKRLCAMLYVNMSSKEIAVITNTTIRSVETSRYRLRKKFNLLRDDDVVEFLRKI